MSTRAQPHVHAMRGRRFRDKSRCVRVRSQVRAETFWRRQQVDWAVGWRPARPRARCERCGGEGRVAPQVRGCAWKVWEASAFAMFSIARSCVRGYVQNISALRRS